MTRFSLDFPYAYGQPSAQALFRTVPEDFQVDEDLGLELAGSGEHLYVQLRKRGQNTLWLARELARFCGVRDFDVGYSGLKDRQAVTTQWFSVYLPKGLQRDLAAFRPEGVELLDAQWHSHKLKAGMHRSNHFVIRLRNLSAPVDHRLEQVAEGVPNYFGEQRFGIDGGNLEQAQALLVERRNIRNRKERGLILSAARSYLFNRVLAQRVQEGSWSQPLDGEDEPSGPLWGRGRPLASGETLALETAVLAEWQEWCHALEHQGLQQERRPLRCVPGNFEGHQEAQDLLLSFSLPPGQYATAVLRELVELQRS